uniref:MATH domain-containing protein n=1 Tax=Macrostomum lignano TaxID=282301 RepID=A0A1I8G6V9_9PLAT
SVLPNRDALQQPLLQQLAKLETRLLDLESTSYDGSLTWRLKDLTAKQRESLTPECSVPFFLRRFGPAFRIQLYLNGWEAGFNSHLSVYIVHIASQVDDPRDWPIVAEVMIRLVNLKDRRHDFVKTLPIDTTSKQRPTAAEGDFLVCCGEPKLATLDEFRERCVKENSCFLQVEIKERRTGSTRERRYIVV